MLDLHRYVALTFDCYGTLIDWEQGIAGFIAPFARAQGQDWSEAHILEAFGDLEHREQERDPAAPYPLILERTFLALCDRLGLRRDVEAAKAFAASVGDWPPFSDTAPAMAQFRDRFVVGILSNVDDASLARSIAAIGTEPDFTVTAERVRSYKPAPAHFEAARAILAERGITPDRWLHIAQSMFHDIAPARRLQIPCCWVNRRARRPGQGATPPAHVVPDYTVSSLAELAALARLQAD